VSGTVGFVRAARASDAAGLARVQVSSWEASLAGLVPDSVLTSLCSAEAVGQFSSRWLEAITKPPTSKHRVHVAYSPGSSDIFGFAAAGPATDEDLWPGSDGELYELHVLPGLGDAGHDGRLLHAVADTLAEDGFSGAVTWALAGDSSRIAFLESAGWAPDGSRSNLDMGVKVPVVRLHTLLAAGSPRPLSRQPATGNRQPARRGCAGSG
jgi:ribosomal protein S18 acetylase RimI-like enzyme